MISFCILNKNKSNRADKPDQRLCLLFTFMQKMDTILNVTVGAQSAEQSGIRKIKVRGETMYTCAKCNVLACGSQDPAVREKMPKTVLCGKKKMEGAYEKYALEENHEFYVLF